MKTAILPGAVLSLFLVTIATPPVVAHHDGSPVYCRQGTPSTSLTGILTKVEFSNPHVRFNFDVMDAKTGNVTNVALELGPPSAVQADNPSVSRTTFKVGDRFTVSGILTGNNTGTRYTYCAGPVTIRVEPAK